MFLKREAYLIRGCGADDRIVYRTGWIVAPALLPETAQNIFPDQHVS